MPAFTLTVNDRDYPVDVPPDMPLLWIIRDVIGLTGTKYGCGRGECGACTVHLEGEPIRSCRMPVSRVGARAITTIEGISPDVLHPVQQAWIAEDVPQCGYCQSGQIMAAAALLNVNPDPTDGQIDRAMDRNICRCGTYDDVRRAIHRAAKGG